MTFVQSITISQLLVWIGKLEMGITAIVFYVICKGVLPVDNPLFPEEICGFVTDVCEGFYEPTIMRGNTDCCAFNNPVSPGSSIGIKNRIGTLGAFFKDPEQRIYLMTNEHVVKIPGNDLITTIHQPAHFDQINRTLDDLATSLANLEYWLSKDKVSNDVREKLIRIESFSLEGLERLAHGSKDIMSEDIPELETVLSVLREVMGKEVNAKCQEMLKKIDKLLMLFLDTENNEKEKLLDGLEELNELKVLLKEA
jgi:hypothetical protein